MINQIIGMEKKEVVENEETSNSTFNLIKIYFKNLRQTYIKCGLIV